MLPIVFQRPFLSKKSGTPLDTLIKEMSLLTLENLKVTTSKEQLFHVHQTTTIKEEEEADPKAHAVSRRRVVLHSHSSVRLELSYRLYPDPFSNASNEYVARCARSWCRSPYLREHLPLDPLNSWRSLSCKVLWRHFLCGASPVKNDLEWTTETLKRKLQPY